MATVIHAFAQNRIFFYSYQCDYQKFNYRVFATPGDGHVPIEHLYTFNLLGDEQRAFLSLLDKRFGEIGIRYDEAPLSEHGYYSYKRGKKRLEVYQHFEKNDLRLRLLMHMEHDYENIIAYYESIPEEIGVKYGSCSGCGSREINPGCRNYLNTIIRGKVSHLCSHGRWRFPSTEAAIPHLLKAFEKQAKK